MDDEYLKTPGAKRHPIHIFLQETFMERRKSPRYPVYLRVYFPEHDLWGYTRNISIDGCFVETKEPIAEGFLSDLLLELPVVGCVLLKGYIHHSGEKGDGVGMQFVQVRFAPDQSDYYSFYAEFLKLMPQLEKLRSDYLDMVQKGLLKLQTLPKQDKK